MLSEDPVEFLGDQLDAMHDNGILLGTATCSGTSVTAALVCMGVVQFAKHVTRKEQMYAMNSSWTALHLKQNEHSS